MERKKSIKLYETEIATLLSLPEEQRGRILTALLANCVGAALPELDPMETAVYTLINAQVERADELSRKRAQAVNTRWEGGKNPENGDTDSYKPEQTDTNTYTNTSTNTITNTDTTTVTNTLTPTGGPGEEPPLAEKGESPLPEPGNTAQGGRQRKKLSASQQKQFALFWEAYPKKQGQGAAEDVWKKLRPSTELTRRILDALEQAKRCPQWQREGGRYIPYPANWLERRQWTDDLRTSGRGGMDGLGTPSYDLAEVERLIFDSAVRNTTGREEGHESLRKGKNPES